MFLRWQCRRRRHPQWGTKIPRGDVLWSAVVVESKRVEGKLKQLHVCFLGSITESAIEAGRSGYNEYANYDRAIFFDLVSARLDALGDRLSPQDRQRIESEITTKVPPFTEEERAWIERQKRASGIKV
jgi:hypothetical protein